ncbi:MAG: sulfotransferase family 2 domain-containing protein [Paracoccaceae bacterium]
MPVIRISGKQVMFIHVPKTGGSSIEARLAEIGPVQLGAGNARNGFPCSPQHFHGTLLEQLFGPEDFDWAFMIVRHPVDRIVSQYRYETGKRRQPSPAPPFSRWLHETLLARRDNPYARDNHMRPQHEFEALGAEVFRFEDGLDAPLAALGRAVGISIDGVRHWRKRSVPTPVAPSAADVAMIRRVYAEDFERYGYD